MIDEGKLEERRAKHRAYYQANKERILARQRAQRAANREAVAARSAEYYRSHFEELSEAARKRYAKNREHHLEVLKAYRERPEWAEEQARRRREWKERNREKVVEYERYRSLRKRGLDAEVIDRDVVWERDAGVCRICGDEADPADWHIEHIVPLAAGGVHRYSNVAISHPACNWAKEVNDPRDPDSPYHYLLD